MNVPPTVSRASGRAFFAAPNQADRKPPINLEEPTNAQRRAPASSGIEA
jgi:hypothetical protein